MLILVFRQKNDTFLGPHQFVHIGVQGLKQNAQYNAWQDFVWLAKKQIEVST